MSTNTPTIQNRKARHDYEILESFEAGIELKGTEVKSIRQGQMQLKDSYVDVSHGQMYLANAHIEPYKQGNRFNHDPERKRRLLMHKHEIIRLGSKVAEKGLTLIPLKIYFTRGKVKVQVGLCKGKNVVDKRHSLKAKEAKRDVDRAMKEANR